MNILYLTTHLNVGGITSYTLTLAKGFCRRGHSVYVASGGGEEVPKFTSEGIIHLDIPIKTKLEVNPFKIIPSLLLLEREIRQRDIQLVHSNTRVTQVLATLLQRRLGIPHVTTCHGYFKNRWFRRKFPCWGDRVIAISEAVQEHLLDDFGLAASRIRLVYNGIDLERFVLPANAVSRDKYSLKRGLGLHDGPVIGIIGRLSDVKGHIFLLEAMPAVLKSFPQAQLLIVGEGPMQGRLKRLAGSLGLAGKCVFIPRIHDTLKALPVIDIFAMPSLKEGLGLSLMEAMAAGLACIGSDIGGIRNLIQHGHNGLLVPPQDAAALSRSILELLEDEKKAQMLADNARIFINHNFSQAEMVYKTQEVYRECLEKPRL